jgi:hypothetical protein
VPVSFAPLAADVVLTDDGLAPIRVKNIDKAYKRPGASLSGYHKILFKPVSVEFSKSWDPHDFGGTFGLKSADVENIRTSLAGLADETFRKRLAAGGYTVVTSAGEMRLMVTLRDSVTGTVLYRAVDKKRGIETGRLEWANRVWNQGEAEMALSGWAKQPKDALDAARTN